MLLCKIGGCHDDSAFSNRIRPDASAHVHHAASRGATASFSRRTCNRPSASSIVYIRTYVRTYPRYTWTARDYGYHVDDWIKCISHARIDYTCRTHIPYHPDPDSVMPAEYFRMRSRDEGVIPRSLRPMQPAFVRSRVKVMVVKFVFTS